MNSLEYIQIKIKSHFEEVKAYDIIYLNKWLYIFVIVCETFLMQLKTVPSLDAKLSDICIGTSALPTKLPPYYFKNGDNEFNLVDGGLDAANPVS